MASVGELLPPDHRFLKSSSAIKHRMQEWTARYVLRRAFLLWRAAMKRPRPKVPMDKARRDVALGCLCSLVEDMLWGESVSFRVETYVIPFSIRDM